MADLLKDMYNQDTLGKLAKEIKVVYSSFQVTDFLASVMDETWESLELKARGHHICKSLRKYLPADYKEAIRIIDQVIVDYGSWLETGVAWVFIDFVELYGQDMEHWDVTMDAIERYTVHASAEFAVRPFIIDHEGRMMAQMYAWSKHENEHVRRLASEGCRPQLPWAQSLPKYKKDPTPILPILEQLKTDPAFYVRKSVANNLNDISKTHPDLVVKMAQDWYGKNADTDWIVKHACRTLLKKGNRDVLAIFGFHDVTAIAVNDFVMEPVKLKIGEEIHFSFTILAKRATKVRLEYGIDYRKANGKQSRKIFQISETALKENERKTYTKKHSFADLSTRKHYVGRHGITLIVNGVERGTLEFELV
ncbi:MAG: DNA alkylation repair protein [Lachnospiraceae bacterium]|nr:DNA alkylation repair protein [Lachnospiraceae bacterium]